MVGFTTLAAPALAFALACLGTRVLIGALTRRSVLDRPNERSSHTTPVPRGGGLAVVAAIAIGWAWLIAAEPSTADPGAADLAAGRWLVALAAALSLAALSFVDDLRSLGAGVRLGAQALAVVVGLWALDGRGALSAFAPAWIDLPLTGLGWLWFVNLYNFMDGIDGITGTETASIGIGLAGLAILGTAPAAVLGPALVLAAAAAGFLVWNWHPARIFLGDVGSVPLGYLLGFLLVLVAGNAEDVPGGDAVAGGGLAAALVLPLVYLVDATLTLGRRLARGENPAQAHREHVYQRAVIAGASHSAVCLRIAAANLILVAVACLLAPSAPAVALAIGAVVVAALFAALRPAPVPASTRRA